MIKGDISSEAMNDLARLLDDDEKDLRGLVGEGYLSHIRNAAASLRALSAKRDELSRQNTELDFLFNEAGTEGVAALAADVTRLEEQLEAEKAKDRRDLFAAHALPATIKIAMKAKSFFDEDPMTGAAKMAYEAADAMLVVRSEVEPEDSEESVLDFWVHE